MSSRRRSQYTIQSDGAGLRSRVDPSNGKIKGKIPSGTEYTQGNAISQRKVPEISIISVPELELVQAVLHSVQGQGLGNVVTNTTRSDELLAHPEKIFKEEEIVRYSNGWDPLSSKPQIKKIKEYHAKEREESKEEAPVASTRKPQSNQLPQERKKKKKKNWRKTYSPSYRIPKIQKDSMENVFNMARTLMEFKDKEEQRT
ncbi:hypothetical protein O181_056682 [Austropuccinia psidii MF-1]|uniref:Uncharacterized protein n=1 Tax=Austropuccinia psidii MF-1 TaxID=1389203 RepID=A0A9Q3EB89_9BASI|nr:hypothetical protein [Austropuccinia psidii MF-1]